MKPLAIFFGVVVSAWIAIPAPGAEVKVDLEKEWKDQFEDLRGQIGNRRWFDRIANQTYDRQSLILEGDRDPAGIVLRRTEALLADLSSTRSSRRSCGSSAGRARAPATARPATTCTSTYAGSAAGSSSRIPCSTSTRSSS